MTEVDEFIKKFNCENCGIKLTCDYIPRNDKVCSQWKPEPCKHEEVYDPCPCSVKGIPDKAFMRCKKCGLQITYIRPKTCGDCKWFESSKIYPCYHPHGVRKVDEFGYCSMWEKK